MTVCEYRRSVDACSDPIVPAPIFRDLKQITNPINEHYYLFCDMTCRR